MPITVVVIECNMMIDHVCLWLASLIYIWMKEAPQPSNTTKIAVMKRGAGRGEGKAEMCITQTILPFSKQHGI
jgi:hypothetical protein